MRPLELLLWLLLAVVTADSIGTVYIDQHFSEAGIAAK